MTTTAHKRSVHVDAPADKVFDYVKDPRHFWSAFYGGERPRSVVTDVNLTPEGVGSTYAWTGSLLAFHFSGVSTREEYVVNKRIVDRSSTGPVWTVMLEPDPTGTNLSMAVEYSTKIPLMDKVIDYVTWRGDRDLDKALALIRRELEA